MMKNNSWIKYINSEIKPFRSEDKKQTIWY